MPEGSEYVDVVRNGPLCMSQMPLNSQPPNSASVKRLLLFKNFLPFAEWQNV